MALIIPGAVQFSLSGGIVTTERWANVWHIAVGSDPFDENEADVVAGAVDDYLVAVRARRHTSWVPQELRVRDIRSEGNPTFTYIITGRNGTAPTQVMPPQVAAVATLRSPTNSRRGRGRTFLNGFVAAALEVATAQFTQAFMDSEAGALAGLAADVQAAGWPLAVASRVAQQVFAVQTVTMDSIPDTQRRRVRDLAALRSASVPVVP